MFSQISDAFFINKIQGSKFTPGRPHQLVTQVNQRENECMLARLVTCWIWALISGNRLTNLTYVDSMSWRVPRLHRWNLEWSSWNCTIGLNTKTPPLT